MSTILLKQRTLVAALILFVISPIAQSRADLTMTLSGNPGSSLIEVFFSGSSVAKSNSVAIINYGWEFSPTSFDPFPAAITGSDTGMFYFTSGVATYRNVTRGLSTSISGVWLQDSSNSPLANQGNNERFGVLEEFIGHVRNENSYAVGDVVEWTGSAMFDLSSKGLTFDDLHPGTTGTLTGALGVLQGQLIIVPEPPASLLFVSFVALVGLRPWLAQRSRCVTKPPQS